MSDHFFPNQSPAILELDAYFRQTVASISETSRLALYEIISKLCPDYTPTNFSKYETLTVAVQEGRNIYFPSPTPVKVLSHILCGYEEWLRRKYCLPEFLAVEPGDVVVDCGAYVAGFSLHAVKIAARVHAFEPDDVNFLCMKHNFQGNDNIVLNHAGLYARTARMPLNISSSSVEHSLLAPDDGETVEVREVDVFSLRDYCQQEKISRLDFVKIEAEGVELEVFDGLGDLRPRKLAIDVSPERNGQSPAAQFHEKLPLLGYETRQRGNVLFAKRT